jgi:hypothetical protein
LKKRNPETCDRCPNMYSTVGCPCWIRPQDGFVETNEFSHEERTVTGCFYAVMPKLMVHVVKAANRPGASMDKLSTQVNGAFRLFLAHQLGPEGLTKLEQLGEMRKAIGKQPPSGN